MPKRVFETTQLIEWGIHLLEECPLIVSDKMTGVDKFEVENEMVFRAPDDGKLWRIEYEWNGGAGWDSISGGWSEYDGKPATPETKQFEGVEVVAREKVVVVYEPVRDEPKEAS